MNRQNVYNHGTAPYKVIICVAWMYLYTALHAILIDAMLSHQ